MAGFVGVIPLTGIPPEVANPVIGWVAVVMGALHARGAWPNKRLDNQAVYGKIQVATVSAQANSLVAALARGLSENRAAPDAAIR